MSASGANFSPGYKRLSSLIMLYRLSMRDTARQNVLLNAEESSDREIAAGFLRAVKWWNGRPPYLRPYTVATFPEIHEELWLRCASVLVLEGVVMLGMRNYATWSDGGTNFSLDAKLPMLQQLVAGMRAQVQQEMDAAKQSQNMEEALGETGSFSEYLEVNASFPNYLYTGRI
jgi:hypothetical protein